MKRKETILEQRLISNGWILTQKTYFGKHSEHIGNYIYEKDDNKIILDAKREKVVDYGIKGVSEDLFNDATLRPYIDQLRNLTCFIAEITGVYVGPSIEAVLDDKEVEIISKYFQENNVVFNVAFDDEKGEKHE